MVLSGCVSLEPVPAANLLLEVLRCFVLGFVPGALWLWYLHDKDDHEPEPWSRVLVVFALGCASTFLVLEIRPSFEDLLPLGNGWDRALADAFLLTAPLEEAVKMLAFLIGIAWHHDLDEPLDGIIYGTAAGLGFASAETVHYLLHENEVATQVGIASIRAFTAMVVHVSATGTLGFCLGMVRFPKGVRCSCSPESSPLWGCTVSTTCSCSQRATCTGSLYSSCCRRCCSS